MAPLLITWVWRVSEGLPSGAGEQSRLLGWIPVVSTQPGWPY